MSDVTPTDDSTAGGTFPGWRVVGASFVCLATTAGLGFYGLAVYLTVLSREQGWSVGSISAAGTLFFFVSGLAGSTNTFLQPMPGRTLLAQVDYQF